MKTITRIIFFKYVFVTNMLCAQASLLDTLFHHFDNYEYEETTKTLKLLNESSIPLNTENDSIRYHFYLLLRNTFNSNNVSDEFQFSRSLDFLIKKNLENYLPYFFLNYAALHGNKASNLKKTLSYLDLSIEVSKKDLNLSHQASELNLYRAYKFSHLLRNSDVGANLKSEYLYKAVLVSESFRENVTISIEEKFKNAFSIALDQSFSPKIRTEYALKSIDYSRNLSELPKYYLYRDLFYILRTENNLEILKNLNEDIDQIVIDTGHITTLDYLVNRCYVDDFSYESCKELIDWVDLLIKSGDNFYENEQNDIFYILNRISIEISKALFIAEHDSVTYSKENIQEILDFRYRFSLTFGDLMQKKFSIDDLIRFYTNIEITEDENEQLKKLKANLLQIRLEILREQPSSLLPYEITEILRAKLYLEYYKDWDREMIEEDVKDIFTQFKAYTTYEDQIQALTIYWEFEIELNEMLSSEYREELSTTKTFILSFLKPEITVKDLPLRLKISSKNELSNLKKIIDSEFQEAQITKAQYNELLLSFYLRKVELESIESNVIELCNFYLENIDSPGFESVIDRILAYYVDFRLKDGVVRLSNYILEDFSDSFLNKSDQFKYSFQISAGNFFKYIRNYKRALNYFLQARSNNYHWNKDKITFSEFSQDNNILFEIFELNMLLSNHSQSRLALESYKEGLEDLTGIYSALSSQGNAYNQSILISTQRKALDMERRQLLVEGKNNEALNILNQMISLEEELPYYDRFNLEKIKLAILVSQYKTNKDSLLVQLDSLYSVHEAQYDSMYYSIRRELGMVSSNGIDNSLSKFEEAIDDINIFESLSYENQVFFINQIAAELDKIEEDILKINSPSTNQIEKLINFKFLIDGIDLYNTRLLNLDRENTDKYFELLNRRSTELNAEKLDVIISEFDVFQQRLKLNLKDIRTFKDVHEFKTKLTDSQAYIRFSSINNNNNAIYVITKNEVELIHIDQLNLDRVIEYSYNQIINMDKDLYTYDILIKPIVDLLPENTNELFIKRDGIFSNLSFEAIWNPKHENFLIDNYDINYVERPEAIFSNNGTISLSSAFLFGNPVFGENEEYNKVNEIRSGIEPLPYTEIEIKEVSKLLIEKGIHTIIANQLNSTEDSLYKNSKSELIHIATHGFYIDGDPGNRFNWGLLASGSKSVLQNDFKKIRRNDGIIFGSEILYKDFTNTELLVLSACDTGFGDTTFYGGENLANSFLRAGAKNIVSTLWKVDDRITQLFMTEFYKNLLTGINIRDALKVTKQKIRLEYPQPYFWAPFVLLQNSIN